MYKHYSRKVTNKNRNLTENDADIDEYFVNLGTCQLNKLHEAKKIKTDSVQSSSNTCKSYVLKIYSEHGNFLNAI